MTRLGDLLLGHLGGGDPRIAELHRMEQERQRHQGAEQAFAALVAEGYFYLMGKRVNVRIEWPDEQFEETARAMVRQVLEHP